MSVDELDNLLDAVGHGRGLDVEEQRARNGNVRDRLVDLEEMQAVVSERAAQVGGDLEREGELRVAELSAEVARG